MSERDLAITKLSESWVRYLETLSRIERLLVEDAYRVGGVDRDSAWAGVIEDRLRQHRQWLELNERNGRDQLSLRRRVLIGELETILGLCRERLAEQEG